MTFCVCDMFSVVARWFAARRFSVGRFFAGKFAAGTFDAGMFVEGKFAAGKIAAKGVMWRWLVETLYGKILCVTTSSHIDFR